MNKHYLRDWDSDAPHVPHTEAHQRASWGLIVIALLFAFCAWLFAPSAHAQTAPTCAWNADCLQWSRPTTYVDGSTLASTDVASYVIEAAPVGSSTWTQIGTVTAPTQGFTRNGLKDGEQWQYRVSVMLVSGARSAPSAVQTATTTAPLPSPPTLKTVDTLAYEINKSTDTLALNAVGTVALGVSCKPEYDANGLNVVPRDSVKFKTTTRPLVVVAKCG
jgi:hypothetical protein